MTRLSELIAPSFYSLHEEIKQDKFTHYWLKGGRGSCKSTFISVEIILGMMQDSASNAVVIRKVAATLKDTVYEQLVWAIDKLGVSDYWQQKISPLELIYKPTGQKILFRGADKPKKLKSTKVSKGYIRYIWYEEVDELTGMSEIRTINQSLMRGGAKFDVFYSYNPPKSQRNWVNTEVLTMREDRHVHTSTYLTVPKEWLGKQFIIEAEHLKKTKPEAYRHEYLGEAVGTGGEVFTNLLIRQIPNSEIDTFDRIKRGVDFGYAADPFAYVIGHYDRKRKRLYLFDEIYKQRLSNARAADMIKEKGSYRQTIYCDAVEPKSIAEFKSYGLPAKKCKKSPDSVEYGIKFLQSLEAIIIDNVRCPNTAREFLGYELESDGNDGFKDGYPDKNNHTIDAVRYSLTDEISSCRGKVITKKELYT